MGIRNMKKEFAIQIGTFDLSLDSRIVPFSCDRHNEFASKTVSPGDIAIFWRPHPDKRKLAHHQTPVS